MKSIIVAMLTAAVTAQFGTAINTATSTATNTAKDTATKSTSAIKAATKTAKDTATSTANKATSAANTATKTAKDTATKATTAVNSATNTVKDTASSTTTKLTNAANSATSTAKETATSTATKATNAVNSATSTAKDTATSTANKATTATSTNTSTTKATTTTTTSTEEENWHTHGITSTEFTEELRKKQAEESSWHQHGYVHAHASEGKHSHDLEIIRRLIKQKDLWKSTRVDLADTHVKINHRRVIVGHRHEHTHKGRFGAHVSRPVQRVRFTSKEGKDTYVKAKDDCLAAKKLYVLKQEFEENAQVKPEEFECLQNKVNRIENYSQLICQCKAEGPALKSDIEDSETTGVADYDYEEKAGFQKCGCQSVGAKVFKGSLSNFEYAYAYSLIQKSRRESRQSYEEDKGKTVALFENANNSQCFDQKQTKILKTWQRTELRTTYRKEKKTMTKQLKKLKVIKKYTEQEATEIATENQKKLEQQVVIQRNKEQKILAEFRAVKETWSKAKSSEGETRKAAKDTYKKEKKELKNKMEKMTKEYTVKIEKLGKRVSAKQIIKNQTKKIKQVKEVRKEIKTKFTKTTSTIKKSAQSTVTKIESRQCKN